MDSQSPNRGFTLAELLITVSVITILITAITISLSGAMRSSRDHKRVSDMQNIRTALELYYDEHGEYPLATNGEQIGVGNNIDTELAPYLDTIPQDPQHDGVNFYYAYDSVHQNNPPIYINDPNGTGEYGSCGNNDVSAHPDYPGHIAVIGFRSAESPSTELVKQTCSGGNENIHIFDYNITFTPSNPL